MRRTKYFINYLHDDAGEMVWMDCNLPMNTPLMLVHTRRGLGLKRLRTPGRAVAYAAATERTRAEAEDNQTSLL